MRACAGLLLILSACGPVREPVAPLRVATFQCDATIPIGHPTAGKLPAQVIEEPLLLKGLVMIGHPGRPVIIVAIDWCTLSSAHYALFRKRLAEAGG
ncbi:MAG TPA: hypothetical protein VJB14_08255, partial [Planctomycetota bacterium]|nr:hypothetical protein [Planctomycetota bacterium]